MKTALCLLTRNGAGTLRFFVEALAQQQLVGMELLAIDSSSDDDTASLLASAGFRVHVIPRAAFDHAATRQLAVDLNPAAELLIFMTQDAILAGPDALRTLASAFGNGEIGAAYGRQLPAADATPIAAHARSFNYPPGSRLKGLDDRATLGLKTAFISNSFAAYRRSALEAAGGFAKRCIVSEDTDVAARMLLAGWKIAYCAEAQVYHSHNYGWRQEFQRYFDIGVFHARAPWVRTRFGGAEGEGRLFVRSEMNYLLRHAPYLLPSAFFRTGIKYLAFRAGLLESRLPPGLKSRLSMQKAFWQQECKGRNAARTGEAG